MNLVIKYHEEPGRPSPEQYLLREICQEESAAILLKLEMIAKSPVENWREIGAKGVKGFKPIWQLNYKVHRTLFFVHKHFLVVVHTFKKPKRKKQNSAYELAMRRYKDFINYEGSGKHA